MAATGDVVASRSDPASGPDRLSPSQDPDDAGPPPGSEPPGRGDDPITGRDGETSLPTDPPERTARVDAAAPSGAESKSPAEAEPPDDAATPAPAKPERVETRQPATARERTDAPRQADGEREQADAPAPTPAEPGEAGASPSGTVARRTEPRAEPDRATEAEPDRAAQAEPERTVRAEPDRIARAEPQASTAAPAVRSAPGAPPDACDIDFDALFGGERIRFATNRAVIRERSFALLDRVAEATRLCPRARLRIVGHTDDRGHENFNMRLSHARAAAVREYIVRAGGAGEIEVLGRGETTPIASNDTARGRALNRRIEITIMR